MAALEYMDIEHDDGFNLSDSMHADSPNLSSGILQSREPNFLFQLEVMCFGI